MNTVSMQEVIDFKINQKQSEQLKVLINHRHELSLDSTNRVNVEPIIQNMLKKR